MVHLTKNTNTLQKAPDSRGNYFLNEPRAITKTQLPEGYRLQDDVHVVIELQEGNLILFRYDETTVNGNSFSSPQQMIDYILSNATCSDVFYGYADPLFDPSSAACTKPQALYSYDTASNTLYVHGQCGQLKVIDGYYSDGTTIFEARRGVLSPFGACRRR